MSRTENTKNNFFFVGCISSSLDCFSITKSLFHHVQLCVTIFLSNEIGDAQFYRKLKYANLVSPQTTSGPPGPSNKKSDWSDREKRTTSKGGPVFSKLFLLGRTDPLGFGPKYPEILVEWIASTLSYRATRS